MFDLWRESGGILSSDNALQNSISWIRFQIGSLEYFNDLFLPGWIPPLTEMSTRISLWGKVAGVQG
jgi:hypothetical protein